MEQIKKVVVPVDFCENTEKLVDYAVYIGSSLSAELHFVHVVNFYSGDAMLGMPIPAELQIQYETDVNKRMVSFIDDLLDRYPGVTGKIVTGEPVAEIVKFAESLGADLIVISTHGTKGMESILLGSVARRVVKHAHCPVLVMNPFRGEIEGN